MRSNFFDPSWVALLSALDDSSLVSVMRSLLQYYVSGSQDSLFAPVSALSGEAGSCWDTMVKDITAYVDKRKALSAVRKAAGSLGGKKRAQRYHRPDGFSRDVPSEVTEDRPQAGSNDARQEPLYSKEEIDQNKKVRTGAVRVLPSAVAEAGASANKTFVPVPVIMGNMVNGAVQLAQASGFGMQPLFQPVVMNYPSDENGNFNSWFAPEVVTVGAASGKANVLSSKKKETKKKDSSVSVVSSAKKKSSVKYVDPPKSPELVDTTPRHRYGEYENVLLSEKEFNTLKKEFPDIWESWIRRCDEYCERYHKEYKNYLMTIRAWARKDAKKTASSSFVNNSAGSSIGYVPESSGNVSLPTGNPSADCLDSDDEFGFRTAKTEEDIMDCCRRYAYKKLENLPAGLHFEIDSPECADYLHKFYLEAYEMHKKGLL